MAENSKLGIEWKWHTKTPAEIFKIIGTEDHGLTDKEAETRLRESGPNQLPEAKAENIFIIFLRQFKSPLIYVLLGAGLAVFAIGETVDGVVIMTVLLINAVVGSIQEGRARNTILALKKFVETKAIVLRNGRELIIPDSQVVAGDIIILQEGSKVPADARLISVHNLKVDEAALTGESESVHKITEVLSKPDLPILEEANMVFKGTNVVLGNGSAVVVATGIDTAIGQIAQRVADIKTEVPLQTNIRNLSRLIIIVTAVVSIFLFTYGVWRGESLREMFAVVVSISVSVIPEGLPIAITVILATGVWRMSKRKALVKRLQAVEALGQAQVIAVDKTGTLTKNEMMVERVYVDDKFFEIGGVGYEAKGDAKLDGEIINPPNHPELMLAGKIAAFCANARVMYVEATPRQSSGQGKWEVSGDPTEASMYVLAEKLGYNKDDLERESPYISEIPFDYNLKYHAVNHRDNGKILTSVVGAPEVIIGLSTKIWSRGRTLELKDSQRDKITKTFSEMSKKGLRVIAISITSSDKEELEVRNVKDLTFVGLFGLKDGLRLEAKSAVRRAHEAGIRVVMITGDHQETAETIGREALIYTKGDTILTGRDIDKMPDKELAERVTNTTIFARVTPDHKFRIINAYKTRGEIVAMTGDGVNDAPSLVAADLGVGMGIVGTEVAKESSDIILLDDNFGSIISAVEEGRNIYRNIRKVVLYLLSTNIGELLVITGALLLGFPIPLLPAQIIWLNLVTDGFFTIALAMEPKGYDLLHMSYEKPKKYLVDTLMAYRMLIMALPMMIGTLIVFSRYFETDIAKAWTMSLTLLAVFQWLNAWNCRHRVKSIFNKYIFDNHYILWATAGAVVAQLFAVYHPFFQTFLRTVPLSLAEWLVIISFASSVFLTEEMRKFVMRHANRRQTTHNRQNIEIVGSKL